jgi:hypothetical protein
VRWLLIQQKRRNVFQHSSAQFEPITQTFELLRPSIRRLIIAFPQPSPIRFNPHRIAFFTEPLSSANSPCAIILTDDYNPVEFYDAPNRESIRRNLAFQMHGL